MKVCQVCFLNLNNCIEFRNELIRKQNKFYEFIESETIEERLDESLLKYDPLEDFSEVKVEIFEGSSYGNDIVRPKSDLMSTVEVKNHSKDSRRFYNCDKCSYHSLKFCRLEIHTRKIHKTAAKKPERSKQKVEVKTRKQCPECGILVKNLSEHEKIIHQSLKRFCCDFCNYSCYFKTKIQRHLQRHIPKHRRLQFPCNECNFFASRKDALKSHQVTMHQKTREKSFLCKECGKSFYNRSQLNIHTKSVHEKVRNHLCNLCGKSFFNSKDLEMHVKRHGEKNLACDICGNLFYCSLDLKRHLKIHSEPLVSCGFEGCNKKFYTNSKLKTHIKVRHEGIKDFFQCDFCRFV